MAKVVWYVNAVMKRMRCGAEGSPCCHAHLLHWSVLHRGLLLQILPRGQEKTLGACACVTSMAWTLHRCA